MGRITPIRHPHKSKADIRRNGYRRGKQPKFEPYSFSMASESKQLSFHMSRAGFTNKELAQAAQDAYYAGLQKSGLYIDSDGVVQIHPNPPKREKLPKVDLDKITNLDKIMLI